MWLVDAVDGWISVVDDGLNEGKWEGLVRQLMEYGAAVWVRKRRGCIRLVSLWCVWREVVYCVTNLCVGCNIQMINLKNDTLQQNEWRRKERQNGYDDVAVCLGWSITALKKLGKVWHICGLYYHSEHASKRQLMFLDISGSHYGYCSKAKNKMNTIFVCCTVHVVEAF